MLDPKRLPKAELHLHIEGTLEPELMFNIAKRNNVKIPYQNIAEVKKAYQFANLQSFLDLYYQAANVLLYEQDFFDLTFAYMKKIATQNVPHVEIFFDPQTHINRNIAFDTVITGIHRALTQAKTDYGITSLVIACFLRDLSEASALECYQKILDHKDKIIGIGLDSAEIGYPPIKFKQVFKKAREDGFRTVAHAGEEGPSDYIWQALKILEVERIDHGIKCIQDPLLVHYLVKEKIPLTVCPLSNVRLQVVPNLKEHPLRTMLQQNLCVTINSDDPAYFKGYINQNFEEVAAALQLTADEIGTLVRNSFQASFLSQEEKDKMIDAIPLT